MMKRQTTVLLAVLLSVALTAGCTPREQQVLSGTQNTTQTPTETQPLQKNPEKNFRYVNLGGGIFEAYLPGWDYDSKTVVTVISSEEELEELLVIGGDWQKDSSLWDYVKGYDPNRFTEGKTTLLAVFLSDSTGSARHGVEGVQVEDGAVTLDLVRMCPDLCTDDMASVLLMVEIEDFAYNGEEIKTNVIDANTDYRRNTVEDITVRDLTPYLGEMEAYKPYIIPITSQEELEELRVLSDIAVDKFIEGYEPGKFTDGKTSLFVICVKEALFRINYVVGGYVLAGDGRVSLDIMRLGPYELSETFYDVINYKVLFVEVEDFAYHGETIHYWLTKRDDTVYA